jgi:16S rRNA (adenine1518-N6/adenine1519-N6)-dimethyltransferase
VTLRARKRLGQHFLHDPAVIKRLVAAIEPRPDDSMVEIGGGRGALTAPLLEVVSRLHVVEVDARLAEELPAAVAHPERLFVHRADALEFDFAALASAPGTLRVVGNLPYNISTPLLFRLLGMRAAIQDMHLMLQREVVERMTAAPGGKEYGRLTVMLALWARAEACFHIGPGAFAPPPRVWSTLVRVVPKPAPDFAVADEAAFAALVAHLFSMRRKTLGRALKGRLSSAQIEAAGIDPIARPETLAPADFARLAAKMGSGTNFRSSREGSISGGN